MGKLSDAKVKSDIIARRGAGESYQSIANTYNVSKEAIFYLCKNHPDEIDRIHEQIWGENIETIVETIKLDILNNKKISDNFADNKGITQAEVAYKTTTNKIATQLLQQKGLMPSSAFLQMNINNDNRKTNVNVDSELFSKLSQVFDTGFIEMEAPKKIEPDD